jgi:hypothetical protein
VSKASIRKTSRKRPPLDDRFEFVGEPAAVDSRRPLRPAQFSVVDRTRGLERSLKLWRKTGTPADEDLRELWRHEMRQVQRVMSYAGAREVIVEIVEPVEDEDYFGILLEHRGDTLFNRRQRVQSQHWLRNLGAQRSRALFWRNMRRLAAALGIIHAQGLVHGGISGECVMTEGGEEPDFQLTGFEWSLWLTADKVERGQARLGAGGQAARAVLYSFSEDWKALGQLVADCLEVEIRKSGDVIDKAYGEGAGPASTSERTLLKRLIRPTRLDNLEAVSIGRAIDDILLEIGREVPSRAGAFVMRFARNSSLGEAVYDASGGAIQADDYREQLDWVRADLDGGATLMTPKSFDAQRSRLRLVTNMMVYTLVGEVRDGVTTWDVAVCQDVTPRADELRIGLDTEHELLQRVEVTTSVKHASETRARLGPDALDWSAFGIERAPRHEHAGVQQVREALLLVQVLEAVIRALDIYPVKVASCEQRDGRHFAVLRAQPSNERDRLARKVGLSETADALSRLFRDDQRESGVRWAISQVTSLGARSREDVPASFTDIVDQSGRHAYRFEIDDPLPSSERLFLRPERDAGTESVIARRLRNLKALSSRVDLAEMLLDPWRARRSSGEELNERDRSDDHFVDLDLPKQEALRGLWSTVPAYLVVGPPGVGKTYLATEIIRRRFKADPASRILLTAQGHDALDHLQGELTGVLQANALDELIVVRSAAADRRPKSDEDIHKKGLEVLRRLSESSLTNSAPVSLRDRIKGLAVSASRLTKSKDAVDREERIALNAVSSLILDAANVVVSTANSPDIESLVEAREQFDWVIVEEAAKATGPELAGPLMLSGRRLMIGDHNQLPPFEADRMVRILQNNAFVTEALGIAESYVGPLMRDGELGELERLAKDPANLRSACDLALRLFEPFKSFVLEDERRLDANPNHRAISATLTEQRRMDPAIAQVISSSFYDNRLQTVASRALKSETEAPPFHSVSPLPASPIVVVDFPHVSATGSPQNAEMTHPRFHNPGEVQSVLNVLEHVTPAAGARPTLAVLTFYKAQVEKLSEAIDGEIKRGKLQGLKGFQPIGIEGGWVNTVDGFQGKEADLIVLSLVRNNPKVGAGALGFLRDDRRMNVALSRAKWKLIIVGSMAFLREAVAGVNPDGNDHHPLAFLQRIDRAIQELEHEPGRDGLLKATSIRPATLKGSAC